MLSYELELRKAAYRYIGDGQRACLDLSLGSGNAKGEKGTGKGKSAWDRQWGKSSKTPDDKQLCLKYNKQIGCNDRNCKFAHVCCRCFGKHSFQQCRFKKAPPSPAAPTS